MNRDTHSVWSEFPKPMGFPVLSENKSTDVLIIGGGIAGILCAYKLKNAGVDCILAEAGTMSVAVAVARACSSLFSVSILNGRRARKQISWCSISIDMLIVMDKHSVATARLAERRLSFFSYTNFSSAR